MSWHPALAALVLLAAAPSAQVVKTIHRGGPTPSCYDLVILGDGYRAVEQAKFDADAVKFMNGLFGHEPWKTYRRYVNIHTVHRASVESGADHPDRNITRNTAYNSFYNNGRCLLVRNVGLATLDATRAPANEGQILMFVNDSRYGGCASGRIATSYNGNLMVDVMAHEIGHTIGKLADEYWTAGRTYTGPEPTNVNATKSPTGEKWKHWRGSNGIGAFQGCRYHEFGLFRPKDRCLMRVLGIGLCSVCGEGQLLAIHERATGIASPTPAATALTLTRPAKQAFGFTDVSPPSANAAITWRLDGRVVAQAVTSYTLDSASLSVGPHRLAVELHDRTPFVRKDSNGMLRQVRAWDLTVKSSSPLPDLQITDLRLSDMAPRGGDVVRMTASVANRGNSRAAAHAIELFVSRDAAITAADTYLGSYPVAALDPGRSTSVFDFGLQLPRHLPAGDWFLGAWVDRRGVVAEFDEANNTRAEPLKLVRPACGAALEFRDPLVYPFAAATLRLGTPGSSVQPTVVAPCRAGHRYVVVWGCSGTSPGTRLDPIGPGLTLPLNTDACSMFGPGQLNSVFFAGFSGTLDTDGLGRATFRLPGVTYRADLPGHFAAVVMDPARPVIVAVTNPVAVTITR